jgi:predicted NAD-dependent protein-ADP-ribosyltransferase YbiA (DUF1768 family)
MQLRMESGQAILLAETEHERAALRAIGSRFAGQDLRITRAGNPLVLAQVEAINITFDSVPMPLRLIANLAEAPFELDGRRYASTEGFWQGLKFPDEASRLRLAGMSGHAAKSAAPPVGPGDWVVYEGKNVCVGTIDHWALMERACRAKFTQHAGARAALLSTGDTPLIHKVEPDSRTIPGIVMADIWMRIRADLAGA